MPLWYNISVDYCAPANPGRFYFVPPVCPEGRPPGTPISRLAWGIGSLQQAIPKLNSKETFMFSLSPKDRVSLCSFTFSDGRRCRAPRVRNNPRFCFYHAQKDARARAAKKLGKDLAYFFSGDYLSACDLSTALARLIPAVLRGDVKPRTARTVAYMAQTRPQSRQLQPRLPLPPRPRTRPARITPTSTPARPNVRELSLVTRHSPLATFPRPTTGPIAAHFPASHERRIR